MGINQEELLKLLEEETYQEVEVKPKKKKSRLVHSVESFIRIRNLKPGPIKVPTYVIYYHYMRFTNSYNYYKRCQREEFFRTFKKHFEQKRTGKQRYYMINDVLELSKEIYEKAEKFQKKQQNERERKQKKSSKVSRNQQEQKSTI